MGWEGVLSVWGLAFGLAALLYPFTVYPLGLALLGRFRSRPWARSDHTPGVSIVIPVHNDGTRAREKIENTLALDYPPDRQEIIVVADGCDEATRAILRGYGSRLTLVTLRDWVGKQRALNAGVEAARFELLLLTDVGASLPRHALRALVRHFASPEVGAVTSVIGPRRSDEGVDRPFTSRDLQLRVLESRVGSTIGCVGAGYVVRRSLALPFPPDMCNDFVSALESAKRGYRVLVDASVAVQLAPSSSAGEEFRRRVRTICRSLRTLQGTRAWVPGFGGAFFSFALWSHKILRLFSPFATLLAATSAGMLIFRWSPPALTALALLGLAACGATLAVPRLQALRPARALAFFVLSQAAALAAWGLFLAGRRFERWEPTRRSTTSEPATDQAGDPTHRAASGLD